MISCQNLVTGYRNAVISDSVSLHVRSGEWFTLIGPNGCGKTTLLRTVAGLLPPVSGEILLSGKQISAYKPRELARLRAYLPQSGEIPALTAGELVRHERYPYRASYASRRMTAADAAAVERAMQITGVSAWKDRQMSSLSGGERQRAYLAMSAAQDAPLLLWDEPTTYLDVGATLDILDLTKTLHQSGKTILMTLHDLSAALVCSDRVGLMDQNGALVRVGTPNQLVASGDIDRVFGVATHAVRQNNQVRYIFTK